LNLGAWNVRTTNDSDSSIRPERATALISGIGFAVSNWLAAQGISPTPISDRLMSMRIQLKGGDNLTFISVYPPAIQR
ncbi:unnamed protein product, partial [Pocillopora meandrina]